MADYGQIAANIADAAAGAAYAVLMTYIADNYIDLADNYFDLYQGQRQFYFNNFQLQGEAPLNAELFAVPFYIPDYAGSTNASALFYFNPFLSQLKGNFNETLANHRRMFNSSDTSTTGTPVAVDLAEITDDWLSYEFRYEEHKRDVYNARRFAQQQDSLAYGVKEGAQVERGLATSFAAFDEAQGQLVSSVNSLANGYFGYSAYRKEAKELLETPKAERSIFSSNFDVRNMQGGAQ